MNDSATRFVVILNTNPLSALSLYLIGFIFIPKAAKNSRISPGARNSPQDCFYIRVLGIPPEGQGKLYTNRGIVYRLIGKLPQGRQKELREQLESELKVMKLKPDDNDKNGKNK